MSVGTNASKSGLPEEESNENANHPPQIDSVPGGEIQVLPPEPQLPSTDNISPEETMGCTSAKSTEPKSKKTDAKQTKITDHMPKKSTDSPPGSAAKKMKKDRDNTPPRDYDQDFSDDEDDQNRAPAKRTGGPVTRSTAALPRLSIDFQDSDNENSDVSRWAKRDIEEYRAGYPDLRPNSKMNTNFRFYMNEIPSQPDGDYIDNIHKNWKGYYRKLEVHHGYIQWLFPLQEAGLNWSADPLQKHEIERIKADKNAMERILKSYELMLDFYGFKLESRETGELRRTENYRDRFDNLNSSSHNYLRITRILKCLGEFDYEHLKYPFLRAILYEAIIENTIPRCLRSCRDYWIETLKDQNERREIRKFARELLKYRTKNIQPPASLLAFERPTPSPKAAKKSPIKHHRQSSDT